MPQEQKSIPQPAEPDYKVLLLKFIEHVGRVEGISFLMSHHRGQRTMETSFKDTSVFTDEEWAQLQLLNEEEPFRDFHHVLPDNWHD
jgi:hypothetical protein